MEMFQNKLHNAILASKADPTDVANQMAKTLVRDVQQVEDGKIGFTSVNESSLTQIHQIAGIIAIERRYE